MSTPLQDTGTLPAVRVTAKREIYRSVNEEESIVQMVERSPHASTRNVPQTRVWGTLHAEGTYPYNLQRVHYLESSDLAQILEFCSLLNGNRRCVVTSCLLTYRNSVATVSVIQLSCEVRWDVSVADPMRNVSWMLFPGGTELETRVKTGSRAGRTHSQ